MEYHESCTFASSAASLLVINKEAIQASSLISMYSKPKMNAKSTGDHAAQDSPYVSLQETASPDKLPLESHLTLQ